MATRTDGRADDRRAVVVPCADCSADDRLAVSVPDDHVRAVRLAGADDGMPRWSDADGACDELVLQDTIGSSSERLYVYVGAEPNPYSYRPQITAWNSVEICQLSLITASPTASPSLGSPIPKRRSEAESSLIVAVAVCLSFAVIACALFIGIRRKLRRSRKPANVPITSNLAAAEAQEAPSAAARLRLEAEPEQLELAGTGLEPEPE